LQISKADAVLLFGAISMHKVFSAMSIATRFLRRDCPPTLLCTLLLPYHIIPPLAIILAAVVGAENPSASLVLTGFSTGTFLYIGAFEVICEEFAEHTQAGPDGGRKEVGRLDKDEEPSGMITGTVANAHTAWRPNKLQTFAAFLLGVIIQLGLLAVKPGAEHVH
jgi:hypothetical protein